VLPERRWLVTARAVTDTTIRVVPSGRLDRLARCEPELTAEIVTLLGARLERAHRRVDAITCDSARERLLRLLYVMADYHGQPREAGVWLPLRLTQTDLGGMVGLARETVARLLGELEAEGLISRRGRSGLWLRAPDGGNET
jgi:CRP-like cAMP-binding protein